MEKEIDQDDQDYDSGIKKRNAAVCVYDFTIWEYIDIEKKYKDGRIVVETVKNAEKSDIVELCRLVAKKWCFQLEKGEQAVDDKDYHYQGRISLKTRLRKNQIVDIFNNKNFKCKISVTSGNCKGNEFYVTKEDGRVKGPWSDRSEPEYVPEAYRGNIKWKPWQGDCLRISSAKADDRTVNCICDGKGNEGKSYLAKYLAIMKQGRLLPPCDSYEKLMGIVMDTPTAPIYFIDIPRAIEKNKLKGLLAGIETLKGGYAFDTRYSFREKFFEPPHVWVFTNVELDVNLLSADRWVWWKITKQGLVKLEDEDNNE